MSDYQKLLALTLSLEQALQDEQWEMVNSLLNERDTLIDSLPAGEANPLATQIEVAQERCKRLIQSRKTEIAQGLADAVAGKRVKATYASGGLQTTSFHGDY